MSFWIEGWVEVTTSPESERDVHSWRGLLRLDPLIDVSDIVSEKLFGLSKRCVVEGAPADAIAAGRGLPANPSAQVMSDVGGILKHEVTFGPGEFGGVTHATWRELKVGIAELADVRNSDWAVVFDILKRVEHDYRFADDRIRIVTWFNW